ncbi:amidohydrolase [Leucobacter allii]|uniref:amidohydrolase n=1 Tax=Leucobacter allii TaxID=2932247 RepID=UPI001FD04823|nr:amidohydrolase [Leucobacter allii]UOR01658.1 amidohydrolase [Leucobacter allii]
MPESRPTLITGRFVRTDAEARGADARPEAMLVEGGVITAIGSREEVSAPAGAARVDLGEGWALPGLIEPHGHPSEAAALLGEGTVDIRPVTIATADGVWAAIRAALTDGPRPARVLANGWDPLLQRGLTPPTMAELDALAGDIPLVIVHNSLHSAYFNAAAAREAGVNAGTPDPAGAAYGRDAAGALTGVALEAAAVMRIAGPALAAARAELPRRMAELLRGMRERGVTTVADLTWTEDLGGLFAGMAAAGTLPTRIRGYEMSRPGARATARMGDGDALVRQVGVKVWSDGSPWVGNIAASFPYLDTPATRAIGLSPGHVGRANYTTEQLVEIGGQYAGEGWQLACHAHGDVAIDSTLDAYETLIERFGLSDHRFRVEHCGLMTPAQYARAQRLGATVSVFVDHLTYWGDVLVDDLFGERGAAWADAGAAFAAGHRATFHNDGTVTPCEPLRNMAVAETRTSRTGRRLGGGTAVSRADALRAHTANAAWQLRSEHEIGALRPGLRADLVVIDADPLTADAESLATATVLATAVDGAFS